MISVCYLVRLNKGKNFLNGINSLKKFYTSYTLYKAGCKHKLFVLIKSPIADINIKKIKNLLSSNVSIIKLPDEGYDIGSYTEFARYRAEKYMFLLNQHSIIQNHNWLKIYLDTLKKNKSKVVATTASNSSFSDPYFSKTKNSGYLSISNIFYKIIKIYFRFKYINFPKYPNPHIRLNALLVKTSLWLKYFKDKDIKTKHHCYEFESGKNSFYKFLIQENEIIPIVRNDGRFVSKRKEWKNFVPFRNTALQSKLLISDNQTRFFDTAKLEKKKKFYYESWR